MNYTILGGGLSAISLAYYLQEDPNISEIRILEKDDTLGGLCRTYEKNGIEYDVGPHIIFSKNKEILELMNGLLGSNIDKIRRSNRILHKNVLFNIRLKTIYPNCRPKIWTTVSTVFCITLMKITTLKICFSFS